MGRFASLIAQNKISSAEGGSKIKVRRFREYKEEHIVLELSKLGLELNWKTYSIELLKGGRGIYIGYKRGVCLR